MWVLFACAMEASAPVVVAPVTACDQSWYQDADQDGFGADGTPETACVAPAGFSASAGDCDDTDASVYPGAEERCELVDEDCDGEKDERTDHQLARWYVDDDGDGYGANGTESDDCEEASGRAQDDGDCDDGDPSVHPGADEECDATIDRDCDGSTGCTYLDEMAEAVLALGYVVRLGDVNGDGHRDVFAGAGIALGSPNVDLDEDVTLSAPFLIPCDPGHDGHLVGAWRPFGGPVRYDFAADGTPSEVAALAGTVVCDDSSNCSEPEVSSCPDWNGDGEADVLVSDGLPDARPGVYFGPLTGTLTLSSATSDVQFEVDRSFFYNVVGAATGDLNGDGLDDLVGQTDASVFVGIGGTTGNVAADALVSVAVGQASNPVVRDLDGDGQEDLSLIDGESGAVLGFLGPIVSSMESAEAAITWVQSADGAGWTGFDAFADFGDDALPDVALTARELVDGTASGIYVYWGPLAGSYELADADDRMPSRNSAPLLRPTAVGDMNGDGADDLAVFDRFDGASYLVLGAP